MRFLTNKEMGIVKKRRKPPRKPLTKQQKLKKWLRMMEVTKFRQGGELIAEEKKKLEEKLKNQKTKR